MSKNDSLTGKFLQKGARVYKKKAFAINTCLVAAAVFISASEYSARNFDFDRQMPVDPSWDLAEPDHESLPGLPALKAMKIPQGSSMKGVSVSATPSPEGFFELDVQGVMAVSMRVSYASNSIGNIILPVDLDRFNVPRHRITSGELKAFNEASRLTGISLGHIMAFASKESNFRPRDSPSTSKAKGYFQHIPDTWTRSIYAFSDAYGYGNLKTMLRRDYWGTMELRTDPKVSAVLAGALLIDDARRIEKELGRKLSPTENYMHHLLGSSKGLTFFEALRDTPNKKVNRLPGMHASIRANRNVFTDGGRYLTVREVMNWADNEIGRRMAYFTLKYETDPKLLHDARQWASDHGFVDVIRDRPRVKVATSPVIDEKDNMRAAFLTR